MSEPASDALLRRAGWDDAWARVWAEALDDLGVPGGRGQRASWAVGRVTRAGRGDCEVLTGDVLTGGGAVRAAWGARLGAAVAGDPAAVPVAGDWVVLGPTGSAEAVLPRRSCVQRAQVARGSSTCQVLAANADLVAVVESLVPDPVPGRLERLLALAWSSGARPVVVLTKADLVRSPDLLVEEVRLLAPGVEVLAVSSVACSGLEPLRQVLAAGSTIALLGASGVGKSTLLNALVGDASVMRTRSLRADGKGRHTTVTRELHLAPGGGAVLDTPGLRSIGLQGSEALENVFADVERLSAACRFGDCAHVAEPGCAVLAAVDRGELSERRLTSYRKLLREAEYQASRVDARVRAARAGRWKAIGVQARQARRLP